MYENLTLQTVKELQRDVARLHEPYLQGAAMPSQERMPERSCDIHTQNYLANLVSHLPLCRAERKLVKLKMEPDQIFF